MACAHKITSGYHCAACCLQFTSLTAFDKHIPAGEKIAGPHKTPHEAGLISRTMKDGSVAYGLALKEGWQWPRKPGGLDRTAPNAPSQAL